MVSTPVYMPSSRQDFSVPVSFYVEEHIVKEMLTFLSPWVYFQEAENKDDEVLGGS